MSDLVIYKKNLLGALQLYFCKRINSAPKKPNHSCSHSFFSPSPAHMMGCLKCFQFLFHNENVQRKMFIIVCSGSNGIHSCEMHIKCKINVQTNFAIFSLSFAFCHFWLIFPHFSKVFSKEFHLNFFSLI